MQNLLIETNSIFLLSNKLSLSLNMYIGVCKKISRISYSKHDILYIKFLI